MAEIDWRYVQAGKDGVVEQAIVRGKMMYRILWHDGRTTTFPFDRDDKGLKRAAHNLLRGM